MRLTEDGGRSGDDSKDKKEEKNMSDHAIKKEEKRAKSHGSTKDASIKKELSDEINKEFHSEESDKEMTKGFDKKGKTADKDVHESSNHSGMTGAAFGKDVLTGKSDKSLGDKQSGEKSLGEKSICDKHTSDKSMNDKSMNDKHLSDKSIGKNIEDHSGAVAGKHSSSKDSKSFEGNSRPENTILFDSVVDNEKSFIRKKLKCAVFDDYYITSNPCVNFYRWILSQFEKIKYKDPSSTLISNMEYLQTQCDKKELFLREGSTEKIAKYTQNIKSANVEDYTAEDFCAYSLACACRNEIKTNLIFFSPKLEEKLVSVYSQSGNSDEKKTVIDRTPFLMNYRSVFKPVKDIINSMEAKNTLDTNRSTSLWADVICRFEISKDKRVEILKDLLKVEYNYIPNRYYE